jgi:hypothetical protein
MKVPRPKAGAAILLVASIVLALTGIGAFLWIFVPHFNIYWLILSPVIITLYELPAVYVFWHYRKRCAAAAKAEGGPIQERSGDPGPS